MKTLSFNRREMLKKLIGVSVGTTIAQVFGVGQSLNVISALADSSNSKNINIVSLVTDLIPEIVGSIAKRTAEGIGEFGYSIGEAGANTIRGVGEGVKLRLTDIISDAEGKRKLQEYSQQQDFQRNRKIIQLIRDDLRDYQAKQIKLKLTEVQSNWDLSNWNSILSRQETEDLLKEHKDCLLILLSPPDLTSDVPSSIRNNLKTDLDELESFLVQYYPDRDRQHPVKFYNDYFKRPIGNINVEQLHKILAPIPTVILDLDVNDYLYTIKVYFWGVKNNQLQFYPSKVWDWENGELICTFEGHSDSVGSVIFNPDGQTLVSSSWDKTIKLWSLRTRELIRTFAGHLDWVNSVAISPDGQVIVSGSRNNTIELWNLKTGELIRAFEGHSGSITSIVISRNGQNFISGSGDKTIKLWNLKTGKLIRAFTGHSDVVYSVAISPDEKTIVSGSWDNNIKLWNLHTGELIRTFTGHSNRVYCVAISPDGRTLVSGSADSNIKLWNLKTGELIRTVGHLDPVVSIAFSPDGHTLASGRENKTIKIWRDNLD